MKRNKIIRGVLIVLSLVCFTVLSQSQVQAKSYTAKSIKKEIKKVSSELKKTKEKEKAANKGLKSIAGQIFNSNPLIVKGTWGEGYYWINNSSNMTVLLGLAHGKAKDTGKTKVFYKYGIPYSCKVLTAKKESKVLSNKIISLEKKLKKLKNTKNNSFLVYPSDVKILKGATFNIELQGNWKEKNAFYQGLSFSSNKKSIASVSKSGVVKAKKYGKATVTAKAKVSGKKTKVRFNVSKPYIKFPKSKYYIKEVSSLWSEDIDCDYLSKSSSLSITIGDKSIIKSAKVGIKYTSIELWFTGKPGTTTITAKTKEGHVAKCEVVVGKCIDAVTPTPLPTSDSSQNNNYDEENPSETNSPSLHEHGRFINYDKDYHWIECSSCHEIIQDVRRHIVGGTYRTLISVQNPLRLCRTGICRSLSAG